MTYFSCEEIGEEFSIRSGNFSARLSKDQIKRFRRAVQLENVDIELCVILIQSDWSEAIQLVDLLPNSTALLVRTLSDEALDCLLDESNNLKPHVFLAAQAEKTYRIQTGQ